MIFKPVLPEGADYILKILNLNGYEAYIVGGCVRDSIMGRAPADWDITTAAPPERVKDIFSKIVDTGLKHGTVTVLLGDESFEVTTFRVDGRYEDLRRPVSVEYTGFVEADLGRRDFTINAIAYHPETGFIDPFGGIADISARLIRTVGSADDRFREDALRMLRAVRFSARLGFSVAEDAARSIAANCGLIANISSERIRDELTGILLSDNPIKFAMLRETGLLHFIMPEFELCFNIPQHHPYHIYDVAFHSLHAVGAIDKEKCLRWAMLLHDIGKSVTRTTDEKGVDHFYGHSVQSAVLSEMILGRLRFDNTAKDRILRLVRLHDRQIVPDCKSVARAVCTVGEDLFEDLLKVKMADKTVQNPEYNAEGLAMTAEIGRLYAELKEKGRCFSLKDLAIDGNDLIKTGWRQGKEIGRVLKLLLDRVIDDPGLNSREKLLELAAGMKDEQ